MNKSCKKLRFFLGANTPMGFVSRYEQLATPGDWHLYVIKGGPGTGKSTMMKKAAEALENKCSEIEYIHCSSDVDSLDGVIFKDHKISVCDGTPPHVIEPKYPGAFENVIPITDCWNRNYLFENREQIISLSRQISRCHEYCVRFLNAAGSLVADTYRMALEATDVNKISRYAASFASREFPAAKNLCGTEKIRFLSAVTNKGLYSFDSTAEALCHRIIMIDDDYGAVSRILLACLRGEAMSRGLDVISCYCPLSPYDKLEHLFIPELSLGFMSKNKFNRPDIVQERCIHAKRFTYIEQLALTKKRINFNIKGAAQMIAEASRLLGEAKQLHDKMEAYYIEATDFEKVNKLTESLKAEILSFI